MDNERPPNPFNCRCSISARLLMKRRRNFAIRTNSKCHSSAIEKVLDDKSMTSEHLLQTQFSLQRLNYETSGKDPTRVLIALISCISPHSYITVCTKEIRVFVVRIDQPDGGGEDNAYQPLCPCESHEHLRVTPFPIPSPALATVASSEEDFSDEEFMAPRQPPIPMPFHSASGEQTQVVCSTSLQEPSSSGSGTIPTTVGGPEPSESHIPIPAQSPGEAQTRVLSRIDEFGWQEGRSALTQRAGYLLNNSRMSDVRFLIGESKTEVFGHKTLLALGSPVFEAQFYGAVGHGVVDTVELPDMESDTFLMFLKYLYTDELDEDLDDAQLLNLLRPAKKYIVPHLVDKCTDILMTELKPENIFQILHHAQFYQLRKLERACERYMDRNCNAIVISEEFTNLGKPILTEFLKRDGLSISEEALFQAVLRWATAECQRHSIEENYENFRLVLGECLRLIRFPTMTKEEFAAIYENTCILSAEEACSVFVYMCKNPANVLPEGHFLFPVTKRNFAPSEKIISRFSGEPVEHSLNYRSGEIYNYRVNFKVDRHVFLKGVNVFSIRCGTPIYHGCKRDFSGAVYLYDKGAQQSTHDGRKQFNQAGSLEPDEAAVALNGGRRQYYPVLFDSEIPLQPGGCYTLCVVVSVHVNTHSYQAQPLQSYVGTHERKNASFEFEEDSLTVNFSFIGSPSDGSVGRFTCAQIPELIFSL